MTHKRRRESGTKMKKMMKEKDGFQGGKESILLVFSLKIFLNKIKKLGLVSGLGQWGCKCNRIRVNSIFQTIPQL